MRSLFSVLQPNNFFDVWAGATGARRVGLARRAALCLTASCCSSTSVDGVDATAVLVKHGPLEHQGPQDLL